MPAAEPTPETFYILDVFAESPLAGNQLAVFPRAERLSTDQMQAIARETNFSETTFVTGPERDGAWPTRIFTPRSELPFAGHPTLGTATVLREQASPTPDEIELELGVGRIPVRFAPGADGVVRGTMRQRPPTFGDTVTADHVADALGLSPDDLDPVHPAQKVSTGIEFLVVPIRTLEAVRRASLDPAAYRRLVEQDQSDAIFFFTVDAENDDNQIHARMFAPDHGVPEDPATGSANGCLGGYLLEHDLLGGGDVEVRVEQGYEMGRPSLLFVGARRTDSGVVIEVGGRASLVARGEWLAFP